MGLLALIIAIKVHRLVYDNSEIMEKSFLFALKRMEGILYIMSLHWIQVHAENDIKSEWEKF